jgi:hypothetical protein
MRLHPKSPTANEGGEAGTNMYILNYSMIIQLSNVQYYLLIDLVYWQRAFFVLSGI